MSGSTVGGIVGAAVGFFFGGPAGAKWGFMIGSTAGAILFPPKGMDGPRLNDLSVQVSTYGHSIPRVWGTARIAGNVIWATDLQESAQEEGGKGGPSYTTYSYSSSFAIQWCQGEVIGVRRMWANKTLRYDVSAGNTGPTADGAGWYGGTYTAGSAQAGGFVFYPGSATQPVDPTIQAHKGNTPAYRYRAYSVHEDLSLEKYSNALPQVEAEIVANGSYALPAPLAIGSGKDGGAVDPNTDYLWTTAVDVPSGKTTVYVNDPATKTVIKSIVLNLSDAADITYVSGTNEFWVCNRGLGGGDDVAVISADGMALMRYFDAGVTWPGNVAYISTAQRVYIGRTNGISTGLYAFEIDGTALGLIPGTDQFNWHRKTIDLPELWSSANLFSSRNLVIINAVSQITYVFDSPDFISNTTMQIAWDQTRSRIMWTEASSPSFCYVIEPATGTSTKTTMSPAAPTGITNLIYHNGLDRYIATDGNNLLVINAETFAVEQTIDQGLSPGLLFEHDVAADYVHGLAADGIARRFYLVERLTSLPVPVSDIVTPISEAVGLTAADLDVTDITGVMCDGFVLQDRGAAQAAIEQILMAYQIDVVESGGKVKYVRRAARSAVVIDSEEMGLHDVGQDAPTRLILTRADEIDLPRSVTIKYMNKDADYQIGAQTATRQTTLSRNDVTHELAVVMTDAHAKAVAEAVLYATWAGRTTAKWSMSLKYAEIEPTDLVSIDGNQIIIGKATRRGNMIECEGVFHSGVVFVTGSAAGAAEPVMQTIPLRSKTAIEMMDIPLLRDQDNDAGFYVAAGGLAGQDWPGCVIFKSRDGGGTWDEVATLTTAAVMGAATTVLGDFSRNLIDEANTVTVRLRSGTLSSVTLLAMRNGANAALLGNEIIKFRTATLNADGSYTLSGLLRGRKGSPTSGHAIGERFVLLTSSAVRRIDMATAEIGMERLYKAVTIGDSLASARTIAFTNNATGLECLPGVQIGGGRDAAGNLTGKWIRRTRIGGEWRNYVDAAIGEATESYEIEIWNSTFTTLKRTITGLSLPTFTYSAADQTTDFGGTQATVYVRAYQLSATVGRGFVLQGAI